MEDAAEEKKKRIRRPKKKKHVMVESLATQLTASCLIEDSVVTKTNIVTQTAVKVVAQSKSITITEEIVEISQLNLSLPRKVAKVNYLRFY